MEKDCQLMIERYVTNPPGTKWTGHGIKREASRVGSKQLPPEVTRRVGQHGDVHDGYESVGENPNLIDLTKALVGQRIALERRLFVMGLQGPPQDLPPGVHHYADLPENRGKIMPRMCGMLNAPATDCWAPNPNIVPRNISCMPIVHQDLHLLQVHQHPVLQPQQPDDHVRHPEPNHVPFTAAPPHNPPFLAAVWPPQAPDHREKRRRTTKASSRSVRPRLDTGYNAEREDGECSPHQKDRISCAHTTFVHR